MFKFLIVAVVCASAVIGELSRAEYEVKFYFWLQDFKMQPEDGNTFVRWLENFIDNDKTIENHNGQPNIKYTLGHNKFSHLSFEEWRREVHLGLNKPSLRSKSPNVHQAPADTTQLQSSIDWVSLGAVTGVKDQGQCGSCWSFSTTGSLEGAYKIKYGSLISLSEQNFVDCDTYLNGGSDLGCNGGLMDSAFAWAKKNGGVCTEATYPYVSGTTQKKGSCQQSSCSKVAQSAPASYTDVATNSDAAMMSALNLQPVSIAIEADQKAFQLYQSGVFTATCGTSLDHGVLAVGYGTLDGTDYYKVKNSWGTSWGMDGYILLERGVAQKEGQCGILSGPPSYPTL